MSLVRNLACVAALGALVSCSKDVKKKSADGGGASPGGEGPAQAAVYDPAKDPLVNPPSLSQPIPEDRSLVQEDEVLIRNLDGNPANLNPIFFSAAVESYISELVFDGLFSFDKDMKWFINKEVVESYEESPDHLTVTVKLKPGLKWHDGTPWTAHDVAFSFEAIMDPQIPVPAVRDGTDLLAEVVAVDDLTVRFRHKEALETSKWNMLFPIIPKHIYGNPAERKADPTLKSSDYYNRYNRDELVGNGPYKFVKWDRGAQTITVDRWEDYHGTKPHFKRQILKITADQNTSLQLFIKGEIDEFKLSAQQFALETPNNPDFAKVGVKGYAPSWGYSYIGWNMDGSNPFFTDVRVRRAMAHALDVPRTVRDIGFSLVQQCRGIFAPGSWMHNPDIQLLEYDLKKSAALLDEAGWKIDPNDGFRYKTVDGKKVKFEFELLIPQGSPTAPKISAIFQQDLLKIGVVLKTRILEWAAFMQAVDKHEFQAETAAWGSGTDPDTNSNLWTTDAYENGRNRGKYSNARVDELFVKARAEFDQEKRAAMYREIQQIIYEEQPYLFLWDRSTLWAFNKRLQGVEFSPREVFGFDPSYKAWWVAKHNSMRVF